MELRWRDRGGKLLGTLGTPGEYYSPRISPNGARVAFSQGAGNTSNIWMASLPTNSMTRLTFNSGIDDYPVWSADGNSITYTSDVSGTPNIYRKAVNGLGTIDRLTTNPLRQQPLDWSRDGRFLLFTQIALSSAIMIQAAEGGQPLNFLGHARGACKSQFSPGSPRWIAYDFDDSGRREVYVQAFVPGQTASIARWQISDAGGMMPRWRADGKELFYLSLDGKMMAVSVSGNGPSFQSSTPKPLFNSISPVTRTPAFEYDVSPDGSRFLIIEPAEKPDYLPLTFVIHWLAQ